MNKFKVGDFVKFDSTHGSIGKVHSIPDPKIFGEQYNVRWIYGLDINGDPMTALGCYLKPYELVSITEEEYNKVATRKGWGDEQNLSQKY